MSVYFVIPSKRPLSEADRYLSVWRERGYKLALWRDAGDEPHPACDLLVVGHDYPGWGGAINTLGRMVLDTDKTCDFVVSGGDDTYPDPNKDADQIAFECGRYFGELHKVYRDEPTVSNIPNAPTFGSFPWSTFGVCQPVGDRWGEDDATSRHLFPDHPTHIERIAGSPWIGREYFKRANGGNGPVWAEYKANWDDNELMEVAKLNGAFWQNRDVTHHHDHWQRLRQPCPQFALKWQNTAHFEKNRRLFESRRAQGFPGSQPLPAYAVGR